MLILDWRAKRRSTAPTSSPWNSRTPTPPLSATLSGSTGPGEVVAVVVEVVVVEVAGAGEVAAFEVEAWTNMRLSLLVDGPVGSGGVAVLVLVSARGAMEAAGLEFGAGAGGLVCAVTAVRAMENAAAAQEKVF